MEFEKRCIHKYLTVCQTNPQPPGLGDFLRGTIALFQLAKSSGYSLCFDGSHPIFKYLREHPAIVIEDKPTIELIPPLSYDDIHNRLVALFQSKRPFSVLTNSFYKEEITEECKTFLRDVFKPNDIVEEKIRQVFETVYGISPENGFHAIHIRFGDRFIHNNDYDHGIFEGYRNRIMNVMAEEPTTPHILIADSAAISRKLKETIPELLYWDNGKIHLGDLLQPRDNVLDTLVDFFILSRARTIRSNGSGFSSYVSQTYNIQYMGL